MTYTSCLMSIQRDDLSTSCVQQARLKRRVFCRFVSVPSTMGVGSRLRFVSPS